ncbi:unnamed protein product [Fusarium graminearum]|uniref:Uncharacterized protein n=1 Tax=Gibberella zeae TaxID=5518 RepID=A0A9N8NK74_GIBZA|nr:unnamed protein product [Fusarium graminearum]
MNNVSKPCKRLTTSLRQCGGESPTCIRASISGGHPGVNLDIGPLNFACENDSIDIYPSAALLDIPKPHTRPYSASVVIKFITQTIEESTIVVEDKEEKTRFVYPTFTPNPFWPLLSQGTGSATPTATPTPSKIDIGTVGTVGPRATIVHLKISFIEVTNAAGILGCFILYITGFTILMIYL